MDQHCSTTFLLLALHTASAFATEPPITDIVFAPESDSVVTVSQSGVHVSNWPDLRHQRTIEASAANLHCLAFSRARHLLAVGGGNPSEEGIVDVFSWPGGELIATLNGHSDSVLSLVWIDDSHLVTASLDREIKQWSLQPPNVERVLNGHSRGVTSLCLLNDRKTLVSTGEDQSLRVWNLETGELIRSLNQHTQPVHALALRPVEEGLPMIASAAGDRTIRLWQPTIGRMVRYVRLDAEPLSIVWLDASRIAAVCVDGHVRVVDADEVKLLETLPTIDGWACAIAAHPADGSIAAGGANGQIRRRTSDELSGGTQAGR